MIQVVLEIKKTIVGGILFDRPADEFMTTSKNQGYDLLVGMTVYKSKYSEYTVDFSHVNQTSKRFIGDVPNVRVSLMRNEDYVIVGSVDITLGGYGRALIISDTVGASKIEYTVKFERRDDVMTEPGYLMWIDSISLSGALSLSEDDYQLLVSTI